MHLMVSGMLNITSFTALFLPLYIEKDLPSSINLHSYTDLDSALVQELLSHSVYPIPHTVTDIRQMEFLFFCSYNRGIHAASCLSLFIRICLRFYILFGRTSLLIRRKSLCGFYIQKDTSTDKYLYMIGCHPP